VKTCLSSGVHDEACLQQNKSLAKFGRSIPLNCLRLVRRSCKLVRVMAWTKISCSNASADELKLKGRDSGGAGFTPLVFNRSFHFIALQSYNHSISQTPCSRFTLLAKTLHNCRHEGNQRRLHPDSCHCGLDWEYRRWRSVFEDNGQSGSGKYLSLPSPP
jgi:hypothetical protein